MSASERRVQYGDRVRVTRTWVGNVSALGQDDDGNDVDVFLDNGYVFDLDDPNYAIEVLP